MLNEPFNLDTYNPYDYTNQSMYFNPFIKNETYYETVDPIIIKQIQNFKLTSILLEHRNLTDLTLLTKMGKVLENNKCIEKIYIKKCIISNITPIIKSLHINKTIKLISLKDSKINDLDELFKRLSENTDISLNILNLMNCNVSFTENFYNFIKKNKIIKFINLSKNEQINVPKFYEAIPENRKSSYKKTDFFNFEKGNEIIEWIQRAKPVTVCAVTEAFFSCHEASS